MRMMRAKCSLSIFILASGLVLFFVERTRQHGMLLDPPNRSSLWRIPDFDSLEPEKNYEDNELWCGGMVVQYEQNKGKCGECGDRYDQARPRDNENGGLYGRGIITRKYSPGQIIDISILLTVNHLGWFVFHLCPLPEIFAQETNECFEKYPLRIADGSGYKYKLKSDESGFYRTKLALPPGVECRQCVLRWHYRTGNRWNYHDNHTGALGVGDQEIFRGCSDISIGNVEPFSPRPPASTTPKPLWRPRPTTSRVPGMNTTTTSRPMWIRPNSTSRPRPPGTTTERPLPPGNNFIPTNRPPKPRPTFGPSSSTSTPVATTTTTSASTTSFPWWVTPGSSASTQSNILPQRHPTMRPPNSKDRQWDETPVIISTLGFWNQLK